MRIVEFDGVDVTLEILEPLCSVEEVDARHRLRVVEGKSRWGADMWDWPPGELMRVSYLNAADHRERIGLRRNDGKPLERRVIRRSLDSMADEYEIRTCDAGWEQITLDVLRDAPARGMVRAQTDS